MEKGLRKAIMDVVAQAQEHAKNPNGGFMGIHKGIYADKIIALLDEHRGSNSAFSDRVINWRVDAPTSSGRYFYTHKKTGEVGISNFNIKTGKWTPCQVKSWSSLPQGDL